MWILCWRVFVLFLEKNHYSKPESVGQLCPMNQMKVSIHIFYLYYKNWKQLHHIRLWMSVHEKFWDRTKKVNCALKALLYSRDIGITQRYISVTPPITKVSNAWKLFFYISNCRQRLESLLMDGSTQAILAITMTMETYFTCGEARN